MLIKYFLLFTVLLCFVLDSSVSHAFIASGCGSRTSSTCSRTMSSQQQHHPIEKTTTTGTTTTTQLCSMKRPILDQLASFLFRLENDRVEESSVIDEKGRNGEPMEWSESESLANRFSTVVAGNSLGYRFKQFVADIVAGDDYDVEEVTARIDNFVSEHPVAMFSFSTCPFCRRAKDLLDEKGVAYEVLELDELEGNAGNEIRANLGRKTGRTSVPSIFVGGNYIGGCNDGPGLVPLEKSGELDLLLQEAV